MRHLLPLLLAAAPAFTADPPLAHVVGPWDTTIGFPLRPRVEPTFAGTWDTTFGTMTLTVSGDKVSGHYRHGPQKNELNGTLSGSKLAFTYKEAGASGAGVFELAADGRSFAGTWKQDNDPQAGVWVGVRPKATDFSGVWRSANGPMRLTQTGDAVRGQYLWGGQGGSIEGRVTGKTLTFQYREPRVGRNGKPADAKGSGTFTLGDDGDTLSGTWKPDGATADEVWPTNARVNPTPGKRWLVIVEANWEGSLSEAEYSFGNMLKAFFAGSEEVGVRHRLFTDAASMTRWLGEVAYLAEPVVVVLSCHGSPAGPNAENGPPTAAAIANSLRGASNVTLLHFAACEVLKGRFADDVQKELGADATFPVSGYTTCVDWAGSAVSEFLFYDFILRRGMDPERAMKQLIKAVPYVGDTAPKDSPIPALGMKLRPARVAEKGRGR